MHSFQIVRSLNTEQLDQPKPTISRRIAHKRLGLSLRSIMNISSTTLNSVDVKNGPWIVDEVESPRPDGEHCGAQEDKGSSQAETVMHGV